MSKTAPGGVCYVVDYVVNLMAPYLHLSVTEDMPPDLGGAGHGGLLHIGAPSKLDGYVASTNQGGDEESPQGMTQICGDRTLACACVHGRRYLKVQKIIGGILGPTPLPGVHCFLVDVSFWRTYRKAPLVLIQC